LSRPADFGGLLDGPQGSDHVVLQTHRGCQACAAAPLLSLPITVENPIIGQRLEGRVYGLSAGAWRGNTVQYGQKGAVLSLCPAQPLLLEDQQSIELPPFHRCG